MNTRQKGFYRDKEVLASIEEYRVLDTEQICILHFNDLKHGIVKARQRLRKLYLSKKVNRGRDDMAEPYYYYTDRKPYNTNHTVNKNWGIIYLIHKAQKWEHLEVMQSEYPVGNLQADGFLGFVNTFTDKFNFYFIESDRTDSKNKFNKVRLYNELYSSGAYLKEPWVQKTDKFPEILIITDTLGKMERIENHIKNENSEGLRFKVLTFDGIKQELLAAPNKP